MRPPDYRTVGARILADTVIRNTIVRRQQIGTTFLPDFVRKEISEQFTLLPGIGELEAMASQADSSKNAAVDISLPKAIEIGSLMDIANQQSVQITALYWSISSVALHGVVGQVRTTLAELVAEMRAGTPSSSTVPTAGVANQAVSVAVHGRRSRVTIQSVQASEGSSAEFKVDRNGEDTSFWTKSRRVVMFVAGIASIAVAAAKCRADMWMDLTA